MFRTIRGFGGCWLCQTILSTFFCFKSTYLSPGIATLAGSTCAQARFHAAYLVQVACPPPSAAPTSPGLLPSDVPTDVPCPPLFDVPTIAQASPYPPPAAAPIPSPSTSAAGHPCSLSVCRLPISVPSPVPFPSSATPHAGAPTYNPRCAYHIHVL